MASGIDVVGLVLAVLPLVVEAAKIYSDGVDSILNVALQSRYDESLEDFYDDFYIEMVRLGDLTRQVKNAILYGLTESVKLSDSTQVLHDWQSDPRLENALRDFFITEGRFEEFSVYCSKILRVLEEFVDDKSTKITAAEQSDRVMYSRLRSLADARKRGATTSSLMERFRFSRHSKKRDRFLSNLKKWTDRFEALMEKVAKGAGGAVEVVDERKRNRVARLNAPSSQARKLVTSLYRALYHHHDCSCSESHQFQLRLSTLEDLQSKSDLTIDCFMSHVNIWQEANITLTSENVPSQPFNTILEKLCSALHRCIQDDSSLGLLIQDLNGKQTLWQLRPRPKRLRVLESSNPISLQDLLTISPVKLNLAEKRRLSLIIACSLLLYHESPWLSDEGWLKKDLYFFFKREDEPDLEHPFLSARFNDHNPPPSAAAAAATPAPQDPGDVNVNNDNNNDNNNNKEKVFHPFPQLLALAILLIEIHNEKPIESWRTRRDLDHLTVNTDMMVAERVLGKMDDCPFREAIGACLRMDWVGIGGVGGGAGGGGGGATTATATTTTTTTMNTLEDEGFRAGYVHNVIAPLELEVEWVERQGIMGKGGGMGFASSLGFRDGGGGMRRGILGV